MPLARQVEQHRITITNIVTERRPLSGGIATYAVPFFYFVQGYRGVLAVTSRMEVFPIPPMNRPTVEKRGDQSLVAQKFEQVFFLFFL